MYDCIVIGCGFAGSTAARRLAERGKRVLILEKRDHVGGNCYDEKDAYGILIHRYGPHIFHTNSKKVYEFLSRFTEWREYRHEVEAKIGGSYVPVPFNFHTLRLLYGDRAERLERKLTAEYGEGSRVPILELQNNPDPEIAQIAAYVYDNIFLQYTMKQWGQRPEEIDRGVTARVPVVLSEDDRYFQDVYQGMPKDGFTALFRRMLAHENITVCLSADAKTRIRFQDAGILFDGEAYSETVIATAPVDELFDFRFGMLPYRTLNFVTEHFSKDSYQPKAVINYTVSEAFTRITEYKKLTGQQTAGTTIMKEYPAPYTGARGQIPYYAVSNPESRALYARYRQLAKQYPRLHLLGRLAEYQYYNMDAIVEKALCLAESL